MKREARRMVAAVGAVAVAAVGLVMVASPGQAALPTSGERIAHWSVTSESDAGSIVQRDDILAPAGQRFTEVFPVALVDNVMALTDRQEVHFYGTADLNVPSGVDGSTVRDVDARNPVFGVVGATGEVTTWNRFGGGQPAPEPPADLCPATQISVGATTDYAVVLCEDGSVEAFGRSGLRWTVPTDLPEVAEVRGGYQVTGGPAVPMIRVLTKDRKLLEWRTSSSGAGVTAVENTVSQGKEVASLTTKTALTTSGSFLDIGIGDGMAPTRPVRRGGADPALLAKPLAAVAVTDTGSGQYLTRDGEFDGWSNDADGNKALRMLPSRLDGKTLVSVGTEDRHNAVIVADTEAPEGPKVTTPSQVSGGTNGAVRPGDTLTGTPAAFDPTSDDVTTQWVVDGEPVAGTEDEETFTVTTDHVGSAVAFRTSALFAGSEVPVVSDSSTVTVVKADGPSVVEASSITGFGAPDVAVKGTFATFSDELEDREAYWLVDEEKVAGQGTPEAKELLLTEDMVGKKVRFVTVGYFADDVEVESVSEPLTVRVKLTEVSPAKVEGAPEVGSTLKVTEPAVFSDDSPDVTITHKWYRDFVDVVGEGETYTVTKDDLGSTIYYSAEAIRPGEAFPAYSFDFTGIGPVTAAKPSVETPSSISGFGAPDVAVKGTFATFSDELEDREAYWLVDEEKVAGQGTPEAKELLLTEDMVGKKVRFVTVGYFADDVEVESVSEPLTVRVKLTEVSPAKVEGAPEVGSTLKVTEPAVFSDDSPDVTITHKWYRDFVDVVGEGETYTVTKDDLGSTIYYSAEAIRPGEAFPAYSFDFTGIGPVTKGALTITGLPVIEGDAVVGKTLTAAPAPSSDEDATVSFQWFADGEPIDGATSSTLDLTEALVDKAVTVRQTVSREGATEPGANLARATSEPRTVRAELVDLTVTKPAQVEGKRIVGQTVTGTPATFSDPEAEVTSYWVIDGERSDRTGTTLELDDDLVGSSIRYLSVAERDEDGATAESSSEAQVGPVLATVAVKTPTTLSGKAQVGKTLTATPATFEGGEITVEGSWWADGEKLDQGGASLPLTEDLEGAVITFRATASRSVDGIDEQKTSEASSDPVAAADPSNPGGGTDPEPPAPGVPATDIVKGSTTVERGDVVTLDLGTERAGDKVVVMLFSTPLDLGTHTVAANGTVRVTIPESATLGRHRIAVYDAESGALVAWQAITVVDDAAVGAGQGGTGAGSGGAAGLPDTGASVDAQLIGLGAALLLAGAGAVGFGLRRRPKHRVG
ncbi:hypothetical protein [Aeromicrobium sp. 50.2.37]|uniref:hypothetical protein n=1 Tax=Aeromicrobium sp. 50.2.37 TaxID=2969305 RepID=UPI00214F8F98|nr:hypothetical protein [Aeromicrobium sp. 50.2.37]